jgi:hypothetical protein
MNPGLAQSLELQAAMQQALKTTDKKRTDGLPKNGTSWTDFGQLAKPYRKARYVKLKRERAARKIQMARGCH